MNEPMAMEGPMVEALCERHRPADGQEGEAPEPGIVGLPSQVEVVLCGRIACESLEGKMNESSMVLEGSRGSSNCAKVQLNVAGCSRVAAFPGQIAGVVGRSGSSGAPFHARELLPGLV